MTVKSYNFDDNTQLSPHFNVQEFRCKCSQSNCTHNGKPKVKSHTQG